jgi:hypothetical protein
MPNANAGAESLHSGLEGTGPLDEPGRRAARQRPRGLSLAYGRNALSAAATRASA